jgi:succinate dehydrogenase / fumarate reductase membrane anchor subunit
VVRLRLSGLRAWWVQRASALYLLLFLLFLLLSFALQPLRTFLQWHAWLARPVTSIAFLVFFAALLGHLWVGLRDVLLDYARPARLRDGLLAAVALGLVGLGFWLSSILLGSQA